MGRRGFGGGADGDRFHVRVLRPQERMRPLRPSRPSIANDDPARIDPERVGFLKTRGKKRMQVHSAGGAAAPHKRVVMVSGGRPGGPPRLTAAGDAESLRRVEAGGVEVHHTRGAAAPQQRVNLSLGGDRKSVV